MDSARLINWLPSALQKRLEGRLSLQKILANTGWLFADKILRMGIGLLVGVWVARYLGPEQFGLFNYALAISAIFTAIATLGLNNIVVRDLVKQPDDANTTLGTACILQIIGGIIATFCAIFTVRIIRPDDEFVIIIVSIVGSAMIFRASDVIRYWFESRVQSKYTVWTESGAFLFFALIKGILILGKAPFIYFVWLIFVEAIFIAALHIFVYAMQDNVILKWKFKYERARSLLSDSWPLILSGFAAMLYMRIDQIMIGQILDDKTVGIYSAAVRISEVLYFIPAIVTSSVFPSLLVTREKNKILYKQKVQKLFNLMVALSLIMALLMSVIGDWIVKILYGDDYSEAAKVLIIHVWSGVFVFLGVASGKWFIAENLQKYTFYRTLAGCMVNVILNILLIPRYGAIGAAWATLVSQAIASVFYNTLNSKTRELFFMQLKAMTGAEYFKSRKQA